MDVKFCYNWRTSVLYEAKSWPLLLWSRGGGGSLCGWRSSRSRVSGLAPHLLSLLYREGPWTEGGSASPRPSSSTWRKQGSPTRRQLLLGGGALSTSEAQGDSEGGVSGRRSDLGLDFLRNIGGWRAHHRANGDGQCHRCGQCTDISEGCFISKEKLDKKMPLVIERKL